MTALLRSPPSPRPSLPRAVRSAPPATQSPWRLRSAGFTGVDLPIFHTARIAYPTGRAGLGFHTPRIADAGVPWGRTACPFGDFRGQTGSRECWSERVSHRYTRIVIVLSPQVPACPPPIHDWHTPEHGMNTDRYTTDTRVNCVALCQFRTHLSAPGIDPAAICTRQLPRADRLPVSPRRRCSRIALLQESLAHRQRRWELVAYLPLPSQEEATPRVLEQAEVTSAGRAE